MCLDIREPPQLGAADAEIKVLCGENTELKSSPFRGWSRSVYSHTCYAYCQGFLSCLFLHFRSIHLHFFSKTSPDFSLCWLWLRHGSCVGLQNKIDHPAGWGSRVECPRNINRLKKKHMTCGMMTCEMNEMELEWSLRLFLMQSFVVDWAQSVN